MDLRFSILVPTRQRPDTLLATLATRYGRLATITRSWLRTIAATETSPQSLTRCGSGTREVKHIRSEQVLPMSANWERGLAACSGEYISVLGDDDGFLPSTLDVVRQLIAATDARVIAWEMHTYWWPDTIVHWHKNRLYVSLGNNEWGWINSEPHSLRPIETWSPLATFQRSTMDSSIATSSTP